MNKLILIASFIALASAGAIFSGGSKTISVGENGGITITTAEGKRIVVNKPIGGLGQNLEVMVSAPNVPTKLIQIVSDSSSDSSAVHSFKKDSGKSQADVVLEILREFQGPIDEVTYEKLLAKIEKLVKKGLISQQLYQILTSLDQNDFESLIQQQGLGSNVWAGRVNPLVGQQGINQIYPVGVLGGLGQQQVPLWAQQGVLGQQQVPWAQQSILGQQQVPLWAQQNVLGQQQVPWAQQNVLGQQVPWIHQQGIIGQQQQLPWEVQGIVGGQQQQLPWTQYQQGLINPSVVSSQQQWPQQQIQNWPIVQQQLQQQQLLQNGGAQQQIWPVQGYGRWESPSSGIVGQSALWNRYLLNRQYPQQQQGLDVSQQWAGVLPKQIASY